MKIMKCSLFFITVILSLFFSSCNKNNDPEPDLKDDDFTEVTDSTQLIKIANNTFFPIDNSKQYIYNHTIQTLDDIDNNGWTTETQNETLIFQGLQVYNNTEYRIYDDLKFTTTNNSISILININDSTEILENIVLAHTNSKDTTWSYNISKDNFNGSFTLNQTYDETTKEITVNIPAADVFLGLYQKYKFKENVGLVYKYSEGGNVKHTYELIN